MKEIQDYPIYTPIPSGCKILGTDETGATKNFSIQDVMKTLKSSDYTDATITANCKLIGSDANGDTKSFLFSDIASSVKTKGVRVLSASNTVSSVDANNIIYFTISTNSTLTIPTNLTTSIPVGTEVILIRPASSFTLTVTPASGVFLNSGTTGISIGLSQSYVILTQVAANTWMLSQLL
jgi:hypothetical protein